MNYFGALFECLLLYFGAKYYLCYYFPNKSTQKSWIKNGIIFALSSLLGKIAF